MTWRCSCSDGRSRQRLTAGNALDDADHGLPVATRWSAVDAGVLHHVEARLGVEQVAAAQDDAFAGASLQLAEELPPRRAVVTLQHRATVHSDRHYAELSLAVEDLEKLLTALNQVVDAAPAS